MSDSVARLEWTVTSGRVAFDWYTANRAIEGVTVKVFARVERHETPVSLGATITIVGGKV